MIAKSWFSSCWQWKIGAGVAIAGTLAVRVNSVVLAQIVPDNTLGAESSVVTPNVNIKGVESDRIDNGAIRGANLFHSFEEFNVGAGRGAYFSNPAGIENIFSHVTGAKSSQILGRLGVLGNANLFLINPRGIVFGANSSLDVQGSFIATTADAVKLGDVGLFSTTQSEASNLLTVSPSAILFNTIAAQPIVNRSRAQGSIGPNSAGLFPGLQVQPGRTLALIGGNVLIEGGRLTAAQGRIELGSVAGIGEVSLSQTGNRFVLGYGLINDFGNISLSNRAFVDASGEGGGDVQIQGGRLEMRQSSNIWADTLGVENGGEVLVRTTEAVLSDGSLLSADVAPTGMGTGGNLTVDTSRLIVRDGAQVVVGTLGEGKGGSLQITASESVQLIGTSADGQRSSTLSAQSAGSGDAGELRIDTRRLLMRDGAEVSAATFGEGNGGSLQITASDSVAVIGTSPDGRFSNNLSAPSDGSGDAGELRIDTRRLLVSDGAQLSFGTFGAGRGGSLLINAADSVEVIGTTADGRLPTGLSAQSVGVESGDAGDLTINTGRLLVSDGAQLSFDTFGAGKGGSLQINAADAVEVIGTSRNGRIPSALSAESFGSGDAGDLTINTAGRLLVRDGAVISSASFGDGTAGDINITVRDTLRADNGTISNNTSRSAGGAIAIQAKDIRLLGNSDIRTDVASGADDGGTITLTADSILAFDDSDILAFARDGRGGDITLETPAFFGKDYRPASGGTNLDNNNRVDINATGAVSGIITLPDVSFIQNSLTELPENQINTDSILATSCIVRRNQPTQGSFTVSGTGGLPQRPGDAQTSSFPTVDVATLPSDSTASNPNRHRSWQKGDPIVEPLGVYRLANGKLVLSRECS